MDSVFVYLIFVDLKIRFLSLPFIPNYPELSQTIPRNKLPTSFAVVRGLPALDQDVRLPPG